MTKDPFLARLSQFITAVGNFSVQYNFQAVSIALIVMSASVCTTEDDECKDGHQASWVTSTATATVFVGAITGQLFMGYAGDLLGRNRAMTLTLSIVVLAAMLSASTPTGGATSVYIAILTCRFALGIGVGGIYPLSATKAAEDGSRTDGKVDPTSAGWAFFWQVPGSMTPWLIALLLTYTTISVDARWRLLLGLGSVPSLMVVIGSLTEQQYTPKVVTGSANTPLLYDDTGDEIEKQVVTIDTENNETQQSFLKPTTADKTSDLVYSYMWQKDTWRKLLITGGCWFIYDIAYYGVNLFGGEIISAINDGDDDNISSDKSIRMITQQEVIGLTMGIPACLLAIYSLRVMSIKQLQVRGFVFIALCFGLLAALFSPLKNGAGDAGKNSLFFVYCLLLFSLSYGPNLTTFILPAETFPKEVRSSFNGLSAAMGKLGAFTGVYIFGPLAEVTSYPTVMVVCAVLSMIGAIISHFLIYDQEQEEKRSRLGN